MVSSTALPSNCARGVVIIVALSLCSLISLTHSCTLAASALSVLLKIIVPAYSIWLMKNSPKFLIYIFALEASTTATALFTCTSRSAATSSTARSTSESFPTPEGSIRMRSGA